MYGEPLTQTELLVVVFFMGHSSALLLLMIAEDLNERYGKESNPQERDDETDG